MLLVVSIMAEVLCFPNDGTRGSLILETGDDVTLDNSDADVDTDRVGSEGLNTQSLVWNSNESYFSPSKSVVEVTDTSSSQSSRSLSSWKRQHPNARVL